MKRLAWCYGGAEPPGDQLPVFSEAFAAPPAPPESAAPSRREGPAPQEPRSPTAPAEATTAVGRTARVLAET
ncbi:hypothetical protein [Streptomyces sp. ODS28]|uniref:hypothetical protein n=1 Tax=Streptomyces sp. ODS28 TaxID=3136688 RepID=UPI0031E5169B